MPKQSEQPKPKARAKGPAKPVAQQSNKPTGKTSKPAGKRTANKADKPAANRKPTVDQQSLEDHIEMLRPALRSHGGNIELIGVDGGVVLVKLTGACAGCAMAQLTLKEGVEKFLTKRVKGVTAVRAEGLD